MRDVVIFRNNLFRVSEPFVTDQAQHLVRHRPVYLGRARFGPAPAGAESHALSDAGRTALPGLLLQMATRGPAPFLRLLAPTRPALIHAHFGTDAVYAVPIATALRIPLITTFHGFDATLSTPALLTSPAWANYPLFRGQLARRGHLFLCVSAFIRTRVLALGFPPERTLVHYTGVDCTAIQPRPPEQATATILHVARLVEMKGTEYLLRAYATIAPHHPHTTLSIIGDGPLRARLQALAGSLGLTQQVRFLGAMPHEQALAHIRRAAMLVLPSVLTGTGRVEGLGMVMLEAAACGVPVIASTVGGIPEAITHGQTGLLVPPRDPPALASAMRTLLADPALGHQMGHAARQRAERDFNLQRQTEILEHLYETLAPCQPTPPVLDNQP